MRVREGDVRLTYSVLPLSPVSYLSLTHPFSPLTHSKHTGRVGLESARGEMGRVGQDSES